MGQNVQIVYLAGPMVQKSHILTFSNLSEPNDLGMVKNTILGVPVAYKIQKDYAFPLCLFR